MPISVLIVDDQALVRAGFQMILDAEPDIDVVGEAVDGVAAVALVRRHSPDVVLMDIRMPNMDGLDATRGILAGGRGDPGDRADDVRPGRLHLRGAAGRGERLPAQGHAAGATGGGDPVIAAGEALLSPSVTRRVIAEFARRPARASTPAGGFDDLTAREREVLELIARGLSNAEIAAHLVLSETTVKTHVARVLGKLRLRDRVQAVVLAYESGLVQPGDGEA